LALDRLSTVRTQVDIHEVEIKELKSATQTLKESSIAKEAKDVALALALKEADENRRNQETVKWTPFSRFMAVVTVITAVVALYLGFHH
jgi:anti-sigma-K factor RskA